MRLFMPKNRMRARMCSRRRWARGPTAKKLLRRRRVFAQGKLLEAFQHPCRLQLGEGPNPKPRRPGRLTHVRRVKAATLSGSRRKGSSKQAAATLVAPYPSPGGSSSRHQNPQYPCASRQTCLLGPGEAFRLAETHFVFFWWVLSFFFFAGLTLGIRPHRFRWSQQGRSGQRKLFRRMLSTRRDVSWRSSWMLFPMRG